jgi:hypothetical protein
VAVLALFAACGITVGSWASRVPAVLRHVGTDPEHWGFLALCTALGTVAALSQARRLHRRVGSARVLAVAVPGMLALPPVVAAAPSAPLLAAGLFAHGLATGAAQHPMNVLGLAVERRAGRPLLAGFHGGFSVGLLGGGLAGVAGSAAGIGPVAQHAIVAAGLAAVLAGCRRWLPPDLPDAREVPHGPSAARRRVRTPRIAVLTALAFLALLCEGAMNQWTTIYVTDVLGAGSAAGALAFSAFALAMAAGRLAGDRVTAWLGHAAVLRAGAVLAAAGEVVFLAAHGDPAAAVACAGAALVGAGLACLVPLTLALAGREPGVAPADAVATVLLASWPALVVGPPTIAGIATVAGIRAALGLVVVLALAVALLVRWAAPGEE